MRILRLLAGVLFAIAPFSSYATANETPQSIIHPEWEYTYYNDYYAVCAPGYPVNYYSVYQTCAFTEEKEIDGKNYWLFSLLTETDKAGNPIKNNIPLAYMREDNGRVYMRLHPETPSKTDRYYTHRDTYGYKDRDLMIYDFNLKIGENYQIGEPDTYPTVYNPEPDAEQVEMLYWITKQEGNSPYSYMFVWDNGRLSVADIREDERSQRRAWFMHQKCTYPESLDWPHKKSVILDELDTDFDKTNTRTFRFVEGIGCLKSFLPFPGLYLPAPKKPIYALDHCGTPYLCEITDRTTGETIYKDERRPDKDFEGAVNEIGADGENAAPEYYTLQGIRTLNPEPGEICIVRRGAKVTKEVIAR